MPRSTDTPNHTQSSNDSHPQAASRTPRGLHFSSAPRSQSGHSASGLPGAGLPGAGLPNGGGAPTNAPLSMQYLPGDEKVFFQYLQAVLSHLSLKRDSYLLSPSEWREICGFDWKTRRKSLKEVDRILKRFTALSSLIRRTLRFGLIITAAHNDHAVYSPIHFGFPEFEREGFDVGNFAVVGPWRILKCQSNSCSHTFCEREFEFAEEDWDGALRSPFVCKELMQCAPDVSRFYEHGAHESIREAKEILFSDQLRLLQHLHVAQHCAKHPAVLEKSGRVKWTTILLSGGQRNINHMKSFGRMSYYYNMEFDNIQEASEQTRYLWSPDAFLRYLRQSIEARLVLLERLHEQLDLWLETKLRSNKKRRAFVQQDTFCMKEMEALHWALGHLPSVEVTRDPVALDEFLRTRQGLHPRRKQLQSVFLSSAASSWPANMASPLHFPVPSATSTSGSQLPYSSLTTSNSYSHDFGAHLMHASSLPSNVSSSLLIASTTTNVSYPYTNTNTGGNANTNGNGVRSITAGANGGTGPATAAADTSAANANSTARSKLAKKRMSGSSMSSASAEHLLPNDLTHGLSLLPQRSETPPVHGSDGKQRAPAASGPTSTVSAFGRFSAYGRRVRRNSAEQSGGHAYPMTARSPSTNAISAYGGGRLRKKRTSLLAPAASSKRRVFLHARSKSSVTSSKLGSLRRVFSSPADTPKTRRKNSLVGGGKEKADSRASTPSLTGKPSPTFSSQKSVNDTIASKPVLKKGKSEGSPPDGLTSSKTRRSSKDTDGESDANMSPILISTPEEAAAAMNRRVASASAAPDGPRGWRAPGAQGPFAAGAKAAAAGGGSGAVVASSPGGDGAAAAQDDKMPPPVIIPSGSNHRPHLRGLFRPLQSDTDSVNASPNDQVENVAAPSSTSRTKPGGDSTQYLAVDTATGATNGSSLLSPSPRKAAGAVALSPPTTKSFVSPSSVPPLNASTLAGAPGLVLSPSSTHSAQSALSSNTHSRRFSIGDTIPASGYISGSGRTPFTSRQPRKALITKRRRRGSGFFNLGGGGSSGGGGSGGNSGVGGGGSNSSALQHAPHLRHSMSFQSYHHADTVGRTSGVHLAAAGADGDASTSMLSSSTALQLAFPPGFGGGSATAERRRVSTSRFVGVIDSLTSDMAEMRQQNQILQERLAWLTEQNELFQIDNAALERDVAEAKRKEAQQKERVEALKRQIAESELEKLRAENEQLRADKNQLLRYAAHREITVERRERSLRTLAFERRQLSERVTQLETARLSAHERPASLPAVARSGSPGRGGNVSPRHHSRSPHPLVPLSPPSSALSGAMTTATAAKLYRKVSPVSHDGVAHKSHNGSAERAGSHARTRSAAPLGLHTHYSPPLPSTAASRKPYDFAPFSNLSASQTQNSKFDFFETSDESDVMDLEPPQPAQPGHRPLKLKRSTSSGLGGSGLGGSSLGGPGLGGSRTPTTRRGMLARSIHNSATGTPSMPADVAEYTSEDGDDSSAVVASVHALLARHKDAMLKSRGGSRPKSRGERERGLDLEFGDDVRSLGLREDNLDLEVHHDRMRSNKRERSLGRSSRKSPRRSPAAAAAAAASSGRRGRELPSDLASINSEPTTRLLDEDDLVSPLDISVRMPMSLKKRRNANLSDNDSDDSNADLEHLSGDHLDELDRHRLAHSPFASMRNPRGNGAPFARGFSSHNSSPRIRAHRSRRSSRHRRSHSHTVSITTGTALGAAARGGRSRPGHHRISSTSRVSLGAIEGRKSSRRNSPHKRSRMSHGHSQSDLYASPDRRRGDTSPPLPYPDMEVETFSPPLALDAFAALAAPDRLSNPHASTDDLGPLGGPSSSRPIKHQDFHRDRNDLLNDDVMQPATSSPTITRSPSRSRRDDRSSLGGLRESSLAHTERSPPRIFVNPKSIHKLNSRSKSLLSPRTKGISRNGPKNDATGEGDAARQEATSASASASTNKNPSPPPASSKRRRFFRRLHTSRSISTKQHKTLDSALGARSKKKSNNAHSHSTSTPDVFSLSSKLGLGFGRKRKSKETPLRISAPFESLDHVKSSVFDASSGANSERNGRTGARRAPKVKRSHTVTAPIHEHPSRNSAHSGSNKSSPRGNKPSFNRPVPPSQADSKPSSLSNSVGSTASAPDTKKPLKQKRRTFSGLSPRTRSWGRKPRRKRFSESQTVSKTPPAQAPPPLGSSPRESKSKAKSRQKKRSESTGSTLSPRRLNRADGSRTPSTSLPGAPFASKPKKKRGSFPADMAKAAESVREHLGGGGGEPGAELDSRSADPPFTGPNPSQSRAAVTTPKMASASSPPPTRRLPPTPKTATRISLSPDKQNVPSAYFSFGADTVSTNLMDDFERNESAEEQDAAVAPPDKVAREHRDAVPSQDAKSNDSEKDITPPVLPSPMSVRRPGGPQTFPSPFQRGRSSGATEPDNDELSSACRSVPMKTRSRSNSKVGLLVGKFEQKRRFSEEASLRAHLGFRRSVSVSQSFNSPPLVGRSLSLARSVANADGGGGDEADLVAKRSPVASALSKKRASEPISQLKVSPGILAARAAFEKANGGGADTNGASRKKSPLRLGKLPHIRSLFHEADDEPISPLGLIPLSGNTPSRDRGTRSPSSAVLRSGGGGRVRRSANAGGPTSLSARRKLKLPIDGLDSETQLQGDCTTPKNADVCI